MNFFCKEQKHVCIKYQCNRSHMLQKTTKDPCKNCLQFIGKIMLKYVITNDQVIGWAYSSLSPVRFSLSISKGPFAFFT